jgi:hypothetical protein
MTTAATLHLAKSAKGACKCGSFPSGYLFDYHYRSQNSESESSGAKACCLGHPE